MQFKALGVSCLLAVACVFSVGAQTAVDNGYGGGTRGGSVGLAAVGFDRWYQFDWTGMDCCNGYIGCTTNISNPGTPPWTFTVPAGQTRILAVCDGFTSGDAFTVYDNEIPLGDTSVPGVDTIINCDPDASMVDAEMSHASFVLTEGSHSITICPTNSPYGSGAGFFRISAPPSNDGGGSSGPATGADFRIKQVRLTPNPWCNRKFIVWVQVENIGTVKGDAGYVSLTMDGKFFGAVKVGSLEANGVRKIANRAYKTYKKIVKFTNVKSASGYSPMVLNLKADCYNVTQEANENNNSLTKTVSCK